MKTIMKKSKTSNLIKFRSNWRNWSWRL